MNKNIINKEILEAGTPCTIISPKEMEKILSNPIKTDIKERKAINMIKKGRVKECEWNTVSDIFQRAIKRNKLTEKQILQKCKEILKEINSQ